MCLEITQSSLTELHVGYTVNRAYPRGYKSIYTPKMAKIGLTFLPPPTRICNFRCLSVCLSVGNFALKLPNGFA